MKFGPIGIAGGLDQSVPPRHDHIHALAKRRRRGLSKYHGALLIAVCELGSDGWSHTGAIRFAEAVEQHGPVADGRRLWRCHDFEP